MAGPGALEAGMSHGRTSVVLSESMDGGRIRLSVAVPFAGEVIAKLMQPIFTQQFLYECLRAAPATVTPALASLLALAGAQRQCCQDARSRRFP